MYLVCITGVSSGFAFLVSHVLLLLNVTVVKAKCMLAHLPLGQEKTLVLKEIFFFQMYLQTCLHLPFII